ncbi:MAG: saccharopine dehydrogenase NADP-binding domain-containing protein [Actinomycetota bacterium]|nr:saccharopine dehydrogenase NADP-binding domain-containing protein [Actinomycetota bacterium]
MIVLFGASGYTGGRVAEAMVRRGLRPVLAGRNAGKLASLARRLENLGVENLGLENLGPGKLDVVTADVGDAASVRALIGRGDVLVSTVGPFLRLGEPALRAAVDAGAIYLDSTGEPPFIRRVFDEFGPLAEQTGASLIPAFGHDYVPGNLAGALALRRSGGAVHRIEIGYLISGVGRAQAFSRGTFASLVGLAGEQGFTWRDGIRAEPIGSRMRTFPISGRDCPALTIGSTEHYALPRLAGPEGLPEVDVYLGWFGPATSALKLFSRVTPALLALPGARSLARRIGEFAVRRVAEEPDPVALTRVTPHVISIAYDASGTAVAQVRLVAGDPYQLTADLLAWGAQRAAEHGVLGSGALGPVQAFGLDALQSGALESGLRPL